MNKYLQVLLLLLVPMTIYGVWMMSWFMRLCGLVATQRNELGQLNFDVNGREGSLGNYKRRLMRQMEKGDLIEGVDVATQAQVRKIRLHLVGFKMFSIAYVCVFAAIGWFAG